MICFHGLARRGDDCLDFATGAGYAGGRYGTGCYRLIFYRAVGAMPTALARWLFGAAILIEIDFETLCCGRTLDKLRRVMRAFARHGAVSCRLFS